MAAGHVAEPGAGMDQEAERETGTRHDSPRLEKASNIRESVPVKSDGGFTWYARATIGVVDMPFKDNEDKKVRRLAYYAKKRRQFSRLHESDLSCLKAVMRKLAHNIMRRDRVGQCPKCKKIKPKKQMCAHPQYPRCWCKECRRKAQYAANVAHPERRKASNKRTYLKQKIDPVKHLRKTIRDRLSQAMKRYAGGVNVNGSKLRYLGCSAEDACIYIEQQFKKGMTWNNHGMKGWHIDHVIPLVAFNLTYEDQRRKAFHYTNLQPLWAHDNFAKQGKMPSQKVLRRKKS